MDVLSYNFDVKKIHEQCIQLLTTYGNDTTTQLGLKHTASGHSRNLWFEGVGTSFEDKKRFSVLNELLKGTYIEEVHDTIAKDYSFGRLRIMRMFGRSCMSLHVDREKRIHIPVYTNPNCMMILDNEVIHMPADGNAYMVNTTKIHTALNSNLNFDRIHLLFDLL